MIQYYTKGNYQEERMIVDAKEFFDKVYYLERNIVFITDQMVIGMDLGLSTIINKGEDFKKRLFYYCG